MGKNSSTGLRKIDPERREDYHCAINCLYRTMYSTEEGKRSWFRSMPNPLFLKIPTMEEFQENVNQLVKKQGVELFVFEPNEGEVVAYSACMGKGKILFISEFIVESPEQLKGYGRSFYGEIEEYAKEQGFEQIFLHPEGQGAKCFWRKMGFRKDKTDFWTKKI